MAWLLGALGTAGSAVGSAASTAGSALGTAAGGIGKGVIGGAGKAIGIAGTPLEGMGTWEKVGTGIGNLLASRTKTGQAVSAFNQMQSLFNTPEPKKKKPFTTPKTTEEFLNEIAGQGE
jgi:hypothetical protein